MNAVVGNLMLRDAFLSVNADDHRGTEMEDSRAGSSRTRPVHPSCMIADSAMIFIPMIH